MIKKCIICDEDFEVTRPCYFKKAKYCSKKCVNASRLPKSKADYIKNKQKVLERSKINYQKSKDRKLETCKIWRDNNKDKYRGYAQKRRSTVEGSINNRMSNGIRQALKEDKNGRHWESFVGYNKENLKRHIEALFTAGMNWSEFLKGEIHIDHIVPVSFFKFDSAEDVEFKYCWSLHNLQPLSAFDNLSKGNKINGI